MQSGARLGARERGATAVEYALMVSFIAAVIFAAVVLLGAATDANFHSFVDIFPG